MARPGCLLICAFVLLASSFSFAAVVEHTFTVQNLTVTRLCNQRMITAVNNKLPGPTLDVHEGDTVIVHVINNSPYNLTIHCYTNPYVTDVVVIAPGQTVDVLLRADQPVGSYYMAATPYASAAGASFDNTTTRGIIVYDGAASTATPQMLALPAFNDTPTAHKFYTNITGLVGGPNWVPVPTKVDKRMFVTMGLALEACPENTTCQFINDTKFSASMNNASFEFPTTLSMLQAFFFNVSGIYTTDFPSRPPLKFDYTNSNISLDASLLFAPKSTKVTKLQYNTTVELIFQDTSLIGVENHPMHIHGFNFHVLAQGFGNYDPSKHQKLFNLVNPQIRNTIAVPVGGWAVIRFTANNPGVWLTHCHLDAHISVGLATAFVVENGPTPSTTLPPPPADLPQC
ncbi:hypothetical protein SLEP1_g21509 [Rubroshorea leprosula]|uniref:Laccase n=1 Tax=Rubroshorea leprosula TaxID=152421 RepID=A0AAV5JFG1_9ROSI|nr:hypothetical protein SLEP1_g21509 [Rubroshorea leprosula]